MNSWSEKSLALVIMTYNNFLFLDMHISNLDHTSYVMVS